MILRNIYHTHSRNICVFHCIVWYILLPYDIALHVIVLYCNIFHCIVWYLMLSFVILIPFHGIACYCVVGYGARAVSRKTPIYFITVTEYHHHFIFFQRFILFSTHVPHDPSTPIRIRSPPSRDPIFYRRTSSASKLLPLGHPELPPHTRPRTCRCGDLSSPAFSQRWN